MVKKSNRFGHFPYISSCWRKYRIILFLLIFIKTKKRKLIFRTSYTCNTQLDIQAAYELSKPAGTKCRPGKGQRIWFRLVQRFAALAVQAKFNV